MKVTVDEIRTKAEGLSPGYEQQVLWDGKSHHAKVTSLHAPFNGPPPVYTVSIHRTEIDGQLDVTCSCPASKLCYHAAQFYGVAKAIAPRPTESTERPRKSPQRNARTMEAQREGIQLIERAQEEFAQANQHLLDGLALLAGEE